MVSCNRTFSTWLHFDTGTDRENKRMKMQLQLHLASALENEPNKLTNEKKIFNCILFTLAIYLEFPVFYLLSLVKGNAS